MVLMNLMCVLWFLCHLYPSDPLDSSDSYVILEDILPSPGVFVKQARDFSQAPDIKIHIRPHKIHKTS